MGTQGMVPVAAIFQDVEQTQLHLRKRKRNMSIFAQRPRQQNDPYHQYGIEQPEPTPQQIIERKFDEIRRRLTALEDTQNTHGWCPGHQNAHAFYDQDRVCSICRNVARPGMLSTEANSKGET